MITYKKSNIRISNAKMNYNISFILLAILCIPRNVAYYTLSRIFNFIEILTLVWAMMVFAKAKIYVYRKLWPIWMWVVWIAVATVINGTDYLLAFRMSANIFSVCILSFNMIRSNGKKFIRQFCNFLMSEIVIQMLTGITHIFGKVLDSSGHYQNNYFFGIRVEFNRIFIFALVLSLIYAQSKGIKSKLVFVVSAFSGLHFVLYEDLSMGIGTLGIFLISILFVFVVRKRGNYKRLMYIALAFSIFFNFTVGRFSYVFEWVFNNLLQESLSLNGRTYLWQSALSQIKGWHWLLGNGYGHNFNFSIWFRNWFTATAHSQYINCLFCFGIIGLILYVNICRYQIQAIAEISSNSAKRILFAGFVAVTVMGIANTTYNTLYMYILYVYIVTYDQFVKKYVEHIEIAARIKDDTK